jgi:hypothetical protein
MKTHLCDAKAASKSMRSKSAKSKLRCCSSSALVTCKMAQDSVSYVEDSWDMR